MIDKFIEYIKIHGPWSSAPKGNSKFETLLVKIFILKNKKNKSNTFSYFRTNQILSVQESSLWVLQTRECNGNCKTRAVQADLGTFMHITAYSDIFRGIARYIQDLFRHIHAHSEPCVTLTYLERWYIWSPGIFRILLQSEPCYIHSKPCQTSTMECFRNQLTSNIIFATSAFHVLTFIKKYGMGPEESRGREFLISILVDELK